MFCSCQKEIDLDIPGHKDRLVIDGRIETGQIPFVLLSKSQDIYAPTDLEDLLNSFQKGAVVTVSDGANTEQLQELCSNNLPPGVEDDFAALFGIPVSELPNIEVCLYAPSNLNFVGEVGKTYQLTVEFEGEIYEGSTSILAPWPADSIYWKEDLDVPNFGLSWVTLSDPPGQYDAYFWECKRINKGIDGEPLDAQFETTFNPAFDDTFFDGLTFDFAYENPHNFNADTPIEERGFYARGDTVVIKFSKIDEATYDYMEKKYTQLQGGGSPFAGPVNIPSNMSNGALGVWAGFSPVFDTLICQD